MREYEEGYPVDANDRYYQGASLDPERENSSNFGFANVKRNAAPGGNKAREDATDYLNERLKDLNERLKVLPYESTEVLLEETVEYGSNATKKLNGYADIKVGDTVKVTYDGAEYLLEAYERPNGCAVGNKALTFQGGEDTGEPFAFFSFYRAGVSQLKVFAEGVHKTHTLKIEKIIVDTIEPKYLPSGGSGIGYEENKVLFDQRVDLLEEDEGLTNGLFPFGEFLEQTKYTVTYNGVKYERDAIDPGAGSPIALGNLALFGGSNTGEPFLILVTDVDEDGAPDLQVIDYDANTSVTVKIEKSVIHTIDPEFIPAGVGGGVVIVHDSAMASGVMPAEQAAPTATMNATQIAEAIFAGKTVYFLEPNDQTLLPFVYGYRFGELASGVMTLAAAPDPYALFGAHDSDGYYHRIKVYSDGAYTTDGFSVSS